VPEQNKVAHPTLKRVRDWFDSIQSFKIRGVSLSTWTADGAIFENWFDSLDSVPVRGTAMSAWNAVSDEPPTRDESTREREVERLFAKILKDGMRLMTTREGDLGWAHPLTNSNDGVFLLKGCSVPVILRELNEDKDDEDQQDLHFRVIGDAYVHGIMQGELWEEASERLEKIYLH
jgi:hypothetical protein